MLFDHNLNKTLTILNLKHATLFNQHKVLKVHNDNIVVSNSKKTVTPLKQKGRELLRPIILLLIGILLIALSFVFWFYAVPPISGLATYSLSRPTTKDPYNINATASLIEYFGHNEALNPAPFNQTRPVDYFFNTTLNLRVTKDGPVNVTVYVGNQAVFNVVTNTTMKEITCNTTRYNMYNSTNRPAGMFPNILSNVSLSLFDAFTGGPSPYMLVKNLNPANVTGVTYSFSYNGVHRSSSGITLFMFIIGVVIVVIEGIALLRIFIKRIRER